ncbi:fibroleukin-like [Saccostrea echinata]|uniref:fibroleukin-like n=1 Tax=Saccostrea echinata TaxID=191078 RepID=UPI002A810C96|nr:fibroleukin-like [Saccostrea echinata]
MEASFMPCYVYIIPTDCKEFRDNGHTNSGVIYPYWTSSRPVRVYCDMETLDGGWTAIQKRVSGSLTFDRNWTEYKNGFGSPEQDYWVGNDVIHQLTKVKDCFLYVSITVQNGTRLYELYDKVSVSNEAGKYRILLEKPATGTLGDSMANTESHIFYATAMYFSTKDRDSDYSGSHNLANYYGGAWWFNAGYHAFLNGPWPPAEWTNPWCPIITSGSSVRETMMLIKRH